MITVRLPKALGHAFHLRLAIEKLRGWIAADDVSPKDKKGYQARIAQHEDQLLLYRGA